MPKFALIPATILTLCGAALAWSGLYVLAAGNQTDVPEFHFFAIFAGMTVTGALSAYAGLVCFYVAAREA